MKPDALWMPSPYITCLKINPLSTASISKETNELIFWDTTEVSSLVLALKKFSVGNKEAVIDRKFFCITHDLFLLSVKDSRQYQEQFY